VQGTFERREKRQFEVLRLLSGAPMRYTVLEKAFVKCTDDSPHVFDSIFYGLVRCGWIVKCEDELLSPFRLTEKGKRLLEALS
jgi:predicted transcriptional regulator